MYDSFYVPLDDAGNPVMYPKDKEYENKLVNQFFYDELRLIKVTNKGAFLIGLVTSKKYNMMFSEFNSMLDSDDPPVRQYPDTFAGFFYFKMWGNRISLVYAGHKKPKE
mgnify:CR=1 FL=1